MRIIDVVQLRITYLDGHYVQMHPGPDWSEEFKQSYLQEMADNLSEDDNPTAQDHFEELEHNNNDGSWSVHVPIRS